MPCNCNKKANAGKWVYTAPDGTKQTFATEVQAKAAAIRNGGGAVKPA